MVLGYSGAPMFLAGGGMAAWMMWMIGIDAFTAVSRQQVWPLSLANAVGQAQTLWLPWPDAQFSHACPTLAT